MYGSATGSVVLMLLVVFFDVLKHWTTDRCTAVLVGEAFTASVYAPTSWRDDGRTFLWCEELTCIADDSKIQIGFDDATEEEDTVRKKALWAVEL